MSSASLLGSANSGGVFGSGSTPQQIATGAGAAVSAFGQSAADLLQAQGAGSQVSQYQRAAQLAGMNEDIVKQSTAIQSTQQQRAATIAIGTETATMAGNGFSLGGSNGAILRSSARQAALANSQILSQGQIQENQYVAQQQSDLAQAQAAQIAENAAKNGLRFGVGLRFKTIQVDYAYANEGDFGATNRLGLTLRFSPPARNRQNEAQALYDKAQKDGWTVISMKNDWKQVFAFDKK